MKQAVLSEENTLNNGNTDMLGFLEALDAYSLAFFSNPDIARGAWFQYGSLAHRLQDLLALWGG